MPRFRRSNISLLAALAFILALSLLAGSTAFRHADDHHYTEAALQMITTGDWLIPKDGDGEPRLIKPIVTYWLVAASFKLFGASMFTARLPFILGAGLLIWVTGWLGTRLFNAHSGAWSALILAANLPWLLAGLRTIPDVWLCVFLTLSCAGFLGCILAPNHAAGSAWMGWMGLGLAVATKGMIGLLPLPAILISAVILHRSPRAVFQPLPIVAGLVTGAAWYIAVAVIHGPEFLMAFGQDQLNVAFSVWRVIKQFAAYGVFLLLAFLPWSVALFSLKPADWRAPGILLPGYRPVAVFTLVWTAALIVIFSFAYQFSGGRYVLPAFPWLALIAGAILSRAQRDRRFKRGRFWLTLMVAYVMLLGLLGLCAYLGLKTDLLTRAHVAMVAVATGLVMLVAAGMVFDAKDLWKPAGVAVVILALLPLTYWLVRSGLPNTAHRIAAFIEQNNLGSDQPVLMEGRGSLSGVVRVEAADRVRTTETLNGLPQIAGYDGLIIAAAKLQPDSYPGCRRRTIAYDYERVAAGDLLETIAAGRAPEFLQSKRQPYVWINCAPGAPPGSRNR